LLRSGKALLLKPAAAFSGGASFLKRQKSLNYPDSSRLLSLGGFCFVILQENHELTATRQFAVPSLEYFNDIAAHCTFINLIFFRHDYPPFNLFYLSNIPH